MSQPKVFGIGDVTVSMNQDGTRLYIGHLEIKYLNKLNVKFEDSKLSIEVSFYQTFDSVITKDMEEMIRTVKTVPWIRVIA